MPFLTLDMDKSFHGCDQYPELKTADCRNKDLDTVPQNLSEDTEVLNLYGNNITKLLNSSFEVYPLINSLVISFNDMRAIEVAAFYPLKGLMYLDLSYNRRLVFPTTGVFVMSSQLSILDLRGSNLKSLPNDTLEWSPHLDSVDLSFNQLTFINVSSCGMVDNVDMTGNRLRHLTARDFAFGCRTDTLDLRDNPIKSVDPDVIASLHVRSLVLGGYPLSYEVLANIILGISRSDIEQLTIEDGSVGIFRQLSVVQELNLDYCKLTNLHPLVFSGLESLQKLSLNGNYIQHIHDDVLSGLGQIKSISFDENRIEYLEELMFSNNSSLQPLREKPLLDFDPNELCIMNYGIFSLIPLASISLIVISVLLYHYRWQLRYKRFLLKLAVLGFTEMRDARDHNDYEFDVNIIFYDDDEEWIRRQLRPAFEERLPQFQRNVFGDEDLVLGMHYLNSVDYVVSHSYKTIVVLSRAAVHDHWFILKFRTAMDHVSDTLTEFVVVVFLEDIPDDEMPFLARLYLSDGRPYIYWTENLRGQEYFWAKFTKNLTINLRTNDLLPNE
eukprot:XP_011671170.1 PREDICTED: toll-like receptor 13 [Strongylocentrotus purpuratus]